MHCFSRRLKYSGPILLTVLLFENWDFVWANDSAAEVAAGGIQLRKEARISMEKEQLTISLNKVTVEYEFLNTTDKDIATEVAFPVPPYEFTPESPGGVRDFDDFHVWVNGKAVAHQKSVRAQHKGTDYTQLLRRLRIEIDTFGRFPIPDYDVEASQIGRLPGPERQNLIQLGLTDKGSFRQWSVVKTYHWSQVFPAKGILRVRHEYTPAAGFQPVVTAEIRRELKGVCLDPAVEKRLLSLRAMKATKGGVGDETRFSGGSIYAYAEWVKYILTTANSWAGTIKNFELVVVEPEIIGDKPQPKRVGTSVCWEGSMQPFDKGRLVIRRTNYLPSQELAIYSFLDYD